jgi:N-acetylglutamate synthase-like GNAT family acetyltransferase
LKDKRPADKNRYIYYMIEDFGIAKDEGEIAIYAGMVTSAFTFAEFSAVSVPERSHLAHIQMLT